MLRAGIQSGLSFKSSADHQFAKQKWGFQGCVNDPEEMKGLDNPTPQITLFFSQDSSTGNLVGKVSLFLKNPDSNGNCPYSDLDNPPTPIKIIITMAIDRAHQSDSQ